MRVAVNAEQLLHPSPGGIGRYTAHLLTAVPRAFPDCEIQPFFARHPRAHAEEALRRAGASAETVGRLSVQPLPAGILYEGWVGLSFPPLRAMTGVSVIHAPSVAVPPSGGRPLVVTVHDAAFELFPEAFTPRARRFHRLGLAAAGRRADVVITVSQSAADELVSRSAIRAERIRVVPNGVDPPPADPLADRLALRRLGLEGRPYVLWVGSMEPRKGVGTLVAAMAELRRKGAHPSVATVLAGYDGWLTDGLVATTDRTALGPSLRQLGRVSEEQLWALYRHASLFAFPSRHEGFGLPVIEAMSQGTPVVASDVAALREVTGGAALLLAPGDPAPWAEAIGGLLDDDQARLSLARAGLARSRSFTVDAMAAATHRVYRALGS